MQKSVLDTTAEICNNFSVTVHGQHQPPWMTGEPLRLYQMLPNADTWSNRLLSNCNLIWSIPAINHSGFLREDGERFKAQKHRTGIILLQWRCGMNWTGGRGEQVGVELRRLIHYTTEALRREFKNPKPAGSALRLWGSSPGRVSTGSFIRLFEIWCCTQSR